MTPSASDVAQAAKDLPMPDWHREELDRRQADIDKNPHDTVPWDELKQRLFSKK